MFYNIKLKKKYFKFYFSINKIIEYRTTYFKYKLVFLYGT